MENYTKGEVVHVDGSPLFDLGDTIEMKVNYGSKIRNLMGFSLKKIKGPDVKQIIWSGSGPAVTKTITCVEIMKRQMKGLHQITRMKYKKIEEYWEPKIEGLERLKVNRNIPAISILLSKEPLNKNELGYQAPGCCNITNQAPAVLMDKPSRKISRQGKKRKGSDKPV